MRPQLHHFLLCLTLVFGVTACTLSGDRLPDEDLVETPQEPIPTLLIAPVDTSADSPEVEEEAQPAPVAETSSTLTVWAIELVAPVSETPGGAVMLEELAEYDLQFPDVQVDFQIKRITGAGGMLDYLRTAPPVAPDVLPDVILINRENLLQAYAEGLVVTPSDSFLSSLEIDPYPVATELGMIGDQQVGIPYLLNTTHAVYRSTVFQEVAPTTFEGIAENEVPFIFPAGAITDVNITLLTQYMAGGGRLTNEETGTPVLDAEPLVEILTFYADGREGEIIDPVLFQYSDFGSIWGFYEDSTASLVTVPTDIYLAHRADVRTTNLIPVPSSSEDPFALVSGWMWALTTEDETQQNLVADFLNYLMDPINHGVYTQSLGWLPSQPSALAVWGDADNYTVFGDALLTNAQPLPDRELRSVVGTALQEALEDVLLNDVLPAQAATTAANKVVPAEGDSSP